MYNVRIPVLGVNKSAYGKCPAPRREPGFSLLAPLGHLLICLGVGKISQDSRTRQGSSCRRVRSPPPLPFRGNLRADDVKPRVPKGMTDGSLYGTWCRLMGSKEPMSSSKNLNLPILKVKSSKLEVFLLGALEPHGNNKRPRDPTFLALRGEAPCREARKEGEGRAQAGIHQCTFRNWEVWIGSKIWQWVKTNGIPF